jgi:isocitrate dehydrogenase
LATNGRCEYVSGSSRIDKSFEESEEMARSGPGKKLHVTYDIARQFPGYTDKDGATSSAFADRITQHIG